MIQLSSGFVLTDSSGSLLCILPRRCCLSLSLCVTASLLIRALLLQVTETLTILSLPCNLLDDNTVRILTSGLQVVFRRHPKIAAWLFARALAICITHRRLVVTEPFVSLLGQLNAHLA